MLSRSVTIMPFFLENMQISKNNLLPKTRVCIGAPLFCDRINSHCENHFRGNLFRLNLSRGGWSGSAKRRGNFWDFSSSTFPLLGSNRGDKLLEILLIVLVTLAALGRESVPLEQPSSVARWLVLFPGLG